MKNLIKMILYAILFLLAGFVLRFTILSIAKSGGRRLNKKFVSLGKMQGLTYDDIKRKCGEANHVAPSASGIVAVWAQRGYYIEIKFDREKKFISIVNEVISK